MPKDSRNQIPMAENVRDASPSTAQREISYKPLFYSYILNEWSGQAGQLPRRIS